MEEVSFDGERHTCDHCGLVIEKTGGHDWIGPIPEPGETRRHYHLAREFPECRMVGGADRMPDEVWPDDWKR